MRFALQQLVSRIGVKPTFGLPLALQQQNSSPWRFAYPRLYSSSMSAQKIEDVVAYRANYIKPVLKDLQPLKEAPELYARIHMHNWDMLVTPGDIIKLPINMRDVQVGNTLRFSECSEIGSRNHTLSGGEEGKGRIDPSAFNIKGVVLEKTRVKRAITERTRRRRRHVRHVVSNNCLTVIRVSDISLN